MYLIPKPKQIEKREGAFFISYKSYLCVDKSCCAKIARQALLFNENLKSLLGYDLEITRGSAQEGDIVLIQDNEKKPESYQIEVTEKNIHIIGSNTGLWYGMQTLLQIIQQEGGKISCINIEDEPEIPNRGYYFDVTRGRIPTLEWLKKLADRLAYYKLNQLQLYVEHTYLFRNISELWRDDTPLTAAEIIELDEYCAERGIALVPSLATFGHMFKLLSSKKYSHLCELENSDKAPFCLRSRMHHHTIDATNTKSIELIKNMISEYMGLFQSNLFNICADETFDLGTGRGKEAAQKYGKDRLYVNYVKELCEFLVQNGKIPMFWGDVILGFPELVQELPKETICLNWGYMWNQSEDGTRKMHEAGAVQYCCPGVCAWNMFVNLNWCAYNNNKRMSSYAKKYGAIGVLNTDWGDFLHINHPEFSRPGLIYGAAFSWNTSEIPEYEEINRGISKLEYHDKKEKFLEIVAGIEKNLGFTWEYACRYREIADNIEEYIEENKKCIAENLNIMDNVDEKNIRLQNIQLQMYEHLREIDSDRKSEIYPYIIAIDGMILFNNIGKFIMTKDFGMKFEIMPDNNKLAEELESWFYYYKKVYRTVSKESDLWIMQNMICFYGNYLRDWN